MLRIGLSVHMTQVHKETLTTIENALPNRSNLDVEIFGMEGIPEDVVGSHNQRVISQFAQAEAERRAATGNPGPGGAGSGAAKKPKIEDASDLKKRLAEHKAKKAAEQAAGISSGDATPIDGLHGSQSPGFGQNPGYVSTFHGYYCYAHTNDLFRRDPRPLPSNCRMVVLPTVQLMHLILNRMDNQVCRTSSLKHSRNTTLVSVLLPMLSILPTKGTRHSSNINRLATQISHHLNSIIPSKAPSKVALLGRSEQVRRPFHSISKATFSRHGLKLRPKVVQRKGLVACHQPRASHRGHLSVLRLSTLSKCNRCIKVNCLGLQTLCRLFKLHITISTATPCTMDPHLLYLRTVDLLSKCLKLRMAAVIHLQ